MSDENNKDIKPIKPLNDDPTRNNKGSGEEFLFQFLKVLGITVAGIVLLAVIGFGLLVGFCALGGH